LDIEELRTLVTIADTGSLAGAARRLGHPKSTVAKRVAQLERRLDTRLLERGPRAIRLTDECARLLEPARDIIARADELWLIVRHPSDHVSGPLRISVPTLLGSTLFPPVLARFVSSYPSVDLSVTAEDRYVDLVADGYDCAIRLGPGHDPDVTRRRLGASSLILVAHPDYAEAADAAHPRQLDALDAIAFEAKAGNTIWNLKRGEEAFSLRPKVRLSFRNLPAIAQMLKTFSAVALLPQFLVEEDIRARRLVRVCPGWQGDQHDISVVFSSRSHMPRRLRVFVDHLAAEFRELGL